MQNKYLAAVVSWQSVILHGFCLNTCRQRNNLQVKVPRTNPRDNSTNKKYSWFTKTDWCARICLWCSKALHTLKRPFCTFHSIWPSDSQTHTKFYRLDYPSPLKIKHSLRIKQWPHGLRRDWEWVLSWTYTLTHRQNA